jgi:hypothetical protein
LINIVELRETKPAAKKYKDTERESLDVVKQAILAVIDEWPFSSVQVFAKELFRQLPMVCRRLTDFMGFVMKHLHQILKRSNKTNWLPVHKCQINPGQLPARFNIKMVISRFIMSPGFVYEQIIK